MLYKVKSIGDKKIAGKKYNAGQIIEIDNPSYLLSKGGFVLLNEKKEQPKVEEKKVIEDKIIDIPKNNLEQESKKIDNIKKDNYYKKPFNKDSKDNKDSKKDKRYFGESLSFNN